MPCRQPGSIQSVLRSSSRGLIALALVAAPIGAGAARRSQVRVGTHEDHTRIVLELDEAASYRLAPPGAGGSQLQVQLDADSAARHVASKSPLVKAVRVEPSQRGSTISVDLTQPGLEISEMVLANPPRIVLDVKPAGSMAAMVNPPAAAPRPQPAVPAPVPAPRTAAAPVAPAPPSGERRLSADGKPVVAAQPVAPKGAAPSLSDPVPSDIVSKPAARFEPPAVTPAAQPVAKPIAQQEKPASANPEIVARSAAAPAAAPKPIAPPAAEPAPERFGEPQPTPAAKPAEVVVRRATLPAEPRQAAAAEPSWVDRLTSPTGYAAIGGVLLAGVVLAVRRRRRDEDDDPLYSVMSADDAGAADDDEDLRGQHEESAVGWTPHEAPAAEPEYARPRFDADEPVSRDGSQQLALGRARAPEDEPAPAADPDSLFDGPGAPPLATPPAPTISNAYASDASHAAGELESRMKDLERRIEQLAEARERLERQVAAQTEELRVQRAAIARTQRVVRSMTKGEELA
ncbi:MAG TPA: hypothetical protein VLC53_08635, partial [Myxococcota bacterium]|nr:hypothetical protein [Myxococcota bacterium]